MQIRTEFEEDKEIHGAGSDTGDWRDIREDVEERNSKQRIWLLRGEYSKEKISFSMRGRKKGLNLRQETEREITRSIQYASMPMTVDPTLFFI